MKKIIELGELINKIESLITKHNIEGAGVRFPFGNFSPTAIDSYRGYYNHLALNYENTSECMTVEAFLKMLKKANGMKFRGYKGGEYLMNENTPVWVSDYGHCDNIAVIGVEYNSDYNTIILETAFYSF